MHTTLNADNTATLVVNKDELASINDALDTRVHSAVMGRCQADTLSVTDEETARQLERASYQAYCQLEDQGREPAVPFEGSSERSVLGDQLFNLIVDLNKVYAAGVRAGTKPAVNQLTDTD
jgi:hypothetical protein